MRYDVQDKLNEFKEDLKKFSAIQVVRKHIIFGECCELSQQDYFDLRSIVAKKFGLHPNQVLVVGSAKLGFSIVPKKRFRPFSRNRSDIDVALVSSKLFEQVNEDIYNYKQEAGDWPKYCTFTDYLFQGWIRPDMFPRSPVFPFGKKWWDFFRGLENSRKYGDNKIHGGLYKSYFFIENYQHDCVQQCKDAASISNMEARNENITNQ